MCPKDQRGLNRDEKPHVSIPSAAVLIHVKHSEAQNSCGFLQKLNVYVCVMCAIVCVR